ncbi:MAG: hypothetical protein ACE5FY_02025 [Nitrospiria bacterium]
MNLQTEHRKNNIEGALRGKIESLQLDTTAQIGAIKPQFLENQRWSATA